MQLIATNSFLRFRNSREFQALVEHHAAGEVAGQFVRVRPSRAADDDLGSSGSGGSRSSDNQTGTNNNSAGGGSAAAAAANGAVPTAAGLFAHLSNMFSESSPGHSLRMPAIPEVSQEHSKAVLSVQSSSN